MSKEEKHLKSKIEFLEDKLLRTKNNREMERLISDLAKLRITLQKLYFKRMES